MDHPTPSTLALSLLFALVSAGGACDPAPEAEGEPAWCSASTLPAESGAEHPLADVLQPALESAVDAGLPGVTMAIRDRDGVWLGSAGLADLGRGTPMQPCHRTRIASVTKTFVATTVLLLAERGLIDLDASLTRYLPEQAGQLPHADQISVRQLLDHTSGVYNFLDVAIVLELFNRPRRTWTVDECFANAQSNDAEFSPGSGWGYSNTNYVLLGWIIEAVTGRLHEEVMRTELFERLSMEQTSYRVDGFDFDGVAHGYFDLMGDRTMVDSTDSYANLCVGPDGGMVSTAHDLLVFYDHLFARRDLLGEGSLAAMMPSVETGEDDFPLYGLGVEAWGEGTRRGIGHGGHEFGYRTFAYYFPQHDVTFVVWFNASSLLPSPDNIAAVINAQRDRLRDLALRL
ncbi:MAG: beta-lactamase family protein [Deltaproteobacteria bacterium]|nr:beta-lactamase family protein [Deltaproteobacteria bacterium]